MKCFAIAVPVIIATSCGLASAADTASSAPAIKVETLLQSDSSWNGTPYQNYGVGRPQLSVVRMTIPAHSLLPWHTHPMPNATYIESGHLTVVDKATGETHMFKAGEVFAEQQFSVHRGFTDDEPVTVVVTYAGTPGAQLTVPADGK